MELKQAAIKVAIFIALIAAILAVSQSFVDYNEKEHRFPTMSIQIEDGQDVQSKDTEYSCLISVKDVLSDSFNDLPATIKGRGNSTWGEPKKPYTIKFESKIGLFGYEEAKKWVLLANYKDKSFARNDFAFSVANLLECSYTPDSMFVNLYINGEYMGVYQLCEKVEVAKGRVNIDDSTKKPDFGFLVELDSHAMDEGEEGIDYIEVGGRLYTIKDPSCNKDQAMHVKTILQQSWDVLHSGDWELILENIDVDTFARTYVVQELFSNADVDYSSFYLYRDNGGKLCSGPVWDFDLSCGNHDNVDRIFTDQMFVAENSVWYAPLLEHIEFKEMVAEIIDLNYYKIRNVLKGEYHEVFSNHKNEFEADVDRWGTINMNVYSTPFQYMVITQWTYHLDNAIQWLYNKLDYMYSYYYDYMDHT